MDIEAPSQYCIYLESVQERIHDQQDVVRVAKEKGVYGKIKIMVGGAPVSEAYANEIGADCYTVDAASAADAAVELCKA